MKVSKFFYPVLLWVALAGVVSVGNQPAVLPTRRRAFEHGFDLNRGLFDPGKCRERLLRKQGRALRLRDLQARAVQGDHA